MNNRQLASAALALPLVLAACCSGSPLRPGGADGGPGDGGSTAASPDGSVCPAGTTVCPDDGGDLCVDLSSDPDHCGLCNQFCPRGQPCTEGRCGSCPEGEIVVGSACAPPPSLDGGAEDAGPDAGPGDSGFEDGGFIGDAGPEDAGIEDGGFDAGSENTGTDAGIEDAGPDAGSDAGPLDSGVDAGPEPTECADAGGALDGGTCVFDCAAAASCSKVVCPANLPCAVDCSGAQSCIDSATIDCSQASACDIECSGAQSCELNTVITCSATGPCDVVCSGTQSCQIDLTVQGGAGGSTICCSGTQSCDDDGTAMCSGTPCALYCSGNQACGGTTCAAPDCTDGGSTCP